MSNTKRDQCIGLCQMNVYLYCVKTYDGKHSKYVQHTRGLALSSCNSGDMFGVHHLHIALNVTHLQKPQTLLIATL